MDDVTCCWTTGSGCRHWVLDTLGSFAASNFTGGIQEVHASRVSTGQAEYTTISKIYSKRSRICKNMYVSECKKEIPELNVSRCFLDRISLDADWLGGFQSLPNHVGGDKAVPGLNVSWCWLVGRVSVITQSCGRRQGSSRTECFLMLIGWEGFSHYPIMWEETRQFQDWMFLDADWLGRFRSLPNHVGDKAVQGLNDSWCWLVGTVSIITQSCRRQGSSLTECFSMLIGRESVFEHY